jgi:hypothetical protein
MLPSIVKKTKKITNITVPMEFKSNLSMSFVIPKFNKYNKHLPLDAKHTWFIPNLVINPQMRKKDQTGCFTHKPLDTQNSLFINFRKI